MANFLSDDLKSKIIECVDKGLIDKNDTFELWKIRTEKELIDVLVKLLKVSDDEKKSIFLFIVNEYWKNVDDVFNKNTIFFLKTIINYNCVISREEIQTNEKSFKNMYGINTAVDELIEMEIVDKIKLTNSKVLYVISSKILTKIRGNK